MNGSQFTWRSFLQITLCSYTIFLFSGNVEANTTGDILEPQPLPVTAEGRPERTSAVPIEELEQFVSEAPETLIAVAELEENLYLLEREQAVTGLKINGNAGIGHFREAVTEDKTRDYDRTRLSLGLHYPLLGTLSQEKINVLKADGRTWESRQRIKLAHMKSLEALRSQYVLLWGSQQKMKLCVAFLTDEQQVDKNLTKRKEAGYLLEADRQEFLTAFSLVRRNIANLTAIEKRTLQNINLLTNEQSGNFSAISPAIPSPCTDLASLRSAVVDSHPEIILLRGLIEEQLGVIKLANYSHLKANVSIVGNNDLDLDPWQEGYGIRMQFNIALPWQFSRAERAQEGADQAKLKKLQRSLDLVSGQLLGNAEDFQHRYYAAQENKHFATQRLKTSLESVRERSLRNTYLPGDTFEQLQASRYQYYLAAMDYVDAEIIELQAKIRLLTFCENGAEKWATAAQLDSVINCTFLKPFWSQKSDVQENSQPILRAKHKRKPRNTRQRVGVYAWNSRKLFAQAKAGEPFWERLAENKISRILLSFDSYQLDSLAVPKNEQHLRDFIRKATGKGINIGLLLGEPTWILPEHREKLLQIVNRVQGMGFKIIHLDLEPNQLEHTKLPVEYLLAHLLRTVQAVSRTTSLPVEIDLHPRYLDTDADTFCLGCALKNLDQVSVTMMIYVSNPRRVAEISQPILERFPEMPFSLALSVEPQLSDEESLAKLSKAALQGVIAELDDLTSHKFQSIYIQSWQDYMGMQDEN